MGVCGEEAACKEYENNTYTCVCTHDSQPPTSKGTCPRRIVVVEPGRIPNVQPPSNKLHVYKGNNLQISTIAPSSASTKVLIPENTQNYIFMMGVGGVAVLAIVIVVAIAFRIFHSRNNIVASPRKLKQSLLVSERYAPNPQYSQCSFSDDVPILRKETLTFMNEIGEGCFGKVFKGELLIEETNQKNIVAIKVLKKSATRESEEDFLREVEIMSAFRHPNILSLLGVVLREDTVSPMMVFEYMPLGDLAELLRLQRKAAENETTQLTNKDLFSIALQIANGMKYLAAQRFVHRDLACRNCLVAEGPIVKIADFGMSRDVYTCDYYKIGGKTMLPLRWMSPESVVYGRFTLESDIWSYGVVLWEIYSFAKQPYYGHSNEEVVRLILDGIMLIPPEDCPSLICDLMKNCWKTEPKHRITFPNICDKLEVAFENCAEKIVSDSMFRYENEVRKLNSKSLPRPPPLPMLEAACLDAQGYLLPNEIKEPVQYLETLLPD